MTLENAKFSRINEAFRCISCQRDVPKAKRTCRNHCPFCLTSLHVDENPGDRSASCQGIMRAESYKMEAKRGIILCFRCDRCGALRNNYAIPDDPYAPDDYDLILRLIPG